ncbi:hypothetical protein SKAU_G00029200 [Synaphobranchus kaupii]|uniref:DUF6729 domain-containing protein n=1 Tax=Synaphobranchus kaupii TaxID=118154 RepID=A0A9Q1GF81_SYNKA|nr:hypothetical protein SKAU_G00029190 [Synaphobranchus kaupii]KAJ8382142.1 hypothetical protein SKAU_G00029200 [Synaphobranchus kaupii]
MKKTIPQQDQQWIASTLWRNQRLRQDLKLWRHLTGYGIHKRARQVLDVDRYYLMVTETLRCNSPDCKTNYLSTSKTILDQLSLPLRGEFRLILTRKYACDIRVIRMLRERTLGNSSTRLVKQLRENHGEQWLQRLARYLEVCGDFADRPSLFPVDFQEPPQPVAVPTNRWLLTVYGKDLMSRMGHIKARITSTFGSILKMDSTKKITKKLAGHAKGTALWLTSISNEVGQILISVLTAQEGPGLDQMVSDLIARYTQAGVAPPQLLYVDCGCCVEAGGESKLKTRFSGWPDLVVRLDIYHFLRRLADGCTTDAHHPYPTFMASLSVCIFEWDPADVALLRMAKREQLRQEGVPAITDSLVDRRISKDELALYCRRRTRGEEATIRLIDRLLEQLMGHKGRDLLGVSLLDRERMEHIWQIQKRHVKCIQDLPGVHLYTETGKTTTKEGTVLTKYRCARGSTSLESFHCHLNRFIPGTQANSLNFQLYLLEGLNRWNQDRAAAATTQKQSAFLSYSGDLVQCVNTHSTKVFGRTFVPSFRPPAQYTGEVIGVEYLLRQTGKPMQDMDQESEDTDELLEDVGIKEEQEDEGFQDYALDPTVASLEDLTAFLSTTAAQSSSHTSVHPAPAPVQPCLPSASGAPSPAPSPPPPAQSSASGAIPAPSPPPSPPPAQSSATGAVPPPSSPPALPSTTGPISAPSPAQLPDRAEAAQTSTSGLQPAPASAQPSAVTAPGATSQVPVEELAVDEHCMPGMERVDRLAEFLVGLRKQTSLVIGTQDASTIIALWKDLLPFDQAKVVFSARHHDKLKTGRFRTTKQRVEFTPGVESVRRCAISTSGSPAQWPDCCRLVESIFIRLCNIHRSPVKKMKGTLTRWTLILSDYRKIRQLLLSNGAVMHATTLQMVEALPSANVRPAVAPQQPGVEHTYHLPESTVGQAKVKRRAPTAAAVTAPPAVRLRVAAQRQPFPRPAPAGSFQLHGAPAASPVRGPSSSSTPTPFVFAVPQGFGVMPFTPILLAPPTPQPAAPKTRTRTGESNNCRKCGKHRTAATGHSQYKGHIFCPSFETLTKQQWLAKKKEEDKKSALI